MRITATILLMYGRIGPQAKLRDMRRYNETRAPFPETCGEGSCRRKSHLLKKKYITDVLKWRASSWEQIWERRIN